jgi:hypothetical protein
MPHISPASWGQGPVPGAGSKDTVELVRLRSENAVLRAELSRLYSIEIERFWDELRLLQKRLRQLGDAPLAGDEEQP